jgi:hypothetical protein
MSLPAWRRPIQQNRDWGHGAALCQDIQQETAILRDVVLLTQPEYGRASVDETGIE